MKNILAAIPALFMSAGLSFAQAGGDDALYDPAPPADSAFVRVVYAGGGAIEPSLGGSSLGAMSDAAIGDYVIIPGGDHALSLGGSEETLNIGTGNYYSILVKGGEAELHEDTVLENPSKAQIRFYNLSDATAALHAPAHKIDIFKEIAPMSGTDRAINAVALTLEAKIGNTVAGSFEKLDLVRREGVSVLVAGEAGAYTAISAKDNVAQ